MPSDKSIAELVAEVDIAKMELLSAQTLSSSVMRDETAALNKFNGAAKALDAAIAEMKKSAPRRTDWARVGKENTDAE